MFCDRLEKSIDLNVQQQRVIASFETKCDNLQTLLNAETSQKMKLITQIQVKHLEWKYYVHLVLFHKKLKYL